MLSKAIYQHLADNSDVTNIVGTRIYHSAPPRNPTTPYIVYSLVSDNETQEVQYVTQRYQIDIVGDLRPVNQSATMNSLRDIVVEMFKGFRGTLGSGANTKVIKGAEFGGGGEQFFAKNNGKQLSLDFIFHYLR